MNRAEAMRNNVPPEVPPGTHGLENLPPIPRELFIAAAAELWARGSDTAGIAAALSREALRKGMRGADEHEVCAALDEIRTAARKARAAA